MTACCNGTCRHDTNWLMRWINSAALSFSNLHSLYWYYAEHPTIIACTTKAPLSLNVCLSPLTSHYLSSHLHYLTFSHSFSLSRTVCYFCIISLSHPLHYWLYISRALIWYTCTSNYCLCTGYHIIRSTALFDQRLKTNLREFSRLLNWISERHAPMAYNVTSPFGMDIRLLLCRL